MALEHFADPPTTLRVFRKVDSKLDATRDNTDLLALYRELAELRSDVEAAVLGHYQHVAIRRVHGYFLVGHALAAAEVANAQAVLHLWIAGTAHRVDPINEHTLGVLLRSPSPLLRSDGRAFCFVKVGYPRLVCIGDIFPGAVVASRHDSVKPRALVLMLSEGEGGAAELLCVQAHRRLLRVVASLDKRALLSLTLAVVAEAAHILEIIPVSGILCL